jgi:hypothetical protein
MLWKDGCRGSASEYLLFVHIGSLWKTKLPSVMLAADHLLVVLVLPPLQPKIFLLPASASRQSPSLSCCMYAPQRYIFHDWRAECDGPEWRVCGLHAASHLPRMADVPVMIICSW